MRKTVKAAKAPPIDVDDPAPTPVITSAADQDADGLVTKVKSAPTANATE